MGNYLSCAWLTQKRERAHSSLQLPKKKKKGSRVPRISVYWDPPRQGPNISIYHFHIKDKQSAFSRKQLSISVPRSVEQFPRSGFRFILSPSDLGEPLAKDSRQMV